jgi:UDP-3-O-[3-hydroxymyristoyl] N-acetylglucosamine deacetylase
LRMYQATISKQIEIKGVALHSGSETTLRILPAEAHSGINFRRIDSTKQTVIPACVDFAGPTQLSTTIERDGHRVGTVEHLMAALFGLGIDNAMIEIDGCEVPILDGSSEPFVSAILEVGVRELPALKKYHYIDTSLAISNDSGFITAAPSDKLIITGNIDFADCPIGRQQFTFEYSESAFLELAKARTFCRLTDVESMREAGLALGGSMENAIVVTDQCILNPEGLRFPLEFVCHKILDFIGDLALSGLNLVGKFSLDRPGHSLNIKLAKTLIAERERFLRSGVQVVAGDQSVPVAAAASPAL